MRNAFRYQPIWILFALSSPTFADLPGTLEEIPWSAQIQVSASSASDNSDAAYIEGQKFEYYDFETEKIARRSAAESYRRACENWRLELVKKLSPKAIDVRLDCGAMKMLDSSKTITGYSEGTIHANAKPGAGFVKLPRILIRDCFQWKREIEAKLGEKLFLSSCGRQRGHGLIILGAERGQVGARTEKFAKTEFTSSSSAEGAVLGEADTWMTNVRKYFGKSLIMATLDLTTLSSKWNSSGSCEHDCSGWYTAEVQARAWYYE